MLAMALISLNGCRDEKMASARVQRKTPAALDVSKASKSTSTSSSKYVYEIGESINGIKCTTGAHTFAVKAEYCLALSDDALNNNCGKRGRARAFSQDCGPGKEKNSRILDSKEGLASFQIPEIDPIPPLDEDFE